MESTLKISAPEIWVRAGGRRYCVMLAPPPHTPYTTSSSYRLLHNQLLSPSSWPAAPAAAALSSSSTQAWLSKNTQVASNQKGSKSEALKISTKGDDTQTMIFSHSPVLCHVSLQEVICLRKCCLPVGFGILPPKNQFYCIKSFTQSCGWMWWAVFFLVQDFFGHTKFLISIVYALPI